MPLRHKFYECTMCPKKFKFPGQWRSHLDTHMCEILFKCDICFETFKSIAALRSHKVRLHSETKMQCLICDKVFSSGLLATLHENRRHFSECVNVTCDFCGGQYPSHQKLRKHQIIDHNLEATDNLFLCHVCGEEKYSKYEILKHLIKEH